LFIIAYFALLYICVRFHNKYIPNIIDQTTPCTIATSLFHSKIDYCNSLLLNLPATQTNHLQLALNTAACDVTETIEFHHITAILESPLAQNK